jgi:hypothetical protein
MTAERKTAIKDGFKKVGKAIWSSLPWVIWVICLVCWFLIPVLNAKEDGEYEAQIAALQSANEMYESQNEKLHTEIDWLRSLVEQGYLEGISDGKTK